MTQPENLNKDVEIIIMTQPESLNKDVDEVSIMTT